MKTKKEKNRRLETLIDKAHEIGVDEDECAFDDKYYFIKDHIDPEKTVPVKRP